MVKVLVTGGTGFIGSRLITELRRRGDQVRCLVRRKAKLPDGVEAVHGDLLHLPGLRAALAGVDAVYHLAGATLVRHPHHYRRGNAQGTRLLATACAGLANPPRVVYLSSLAAAGPSTLDRPRVEDDPPAPMSRYGRSKLAGERALQAVSPHVPVTILRAPGVFGPGDAALARLMKAVRMGVMFVPAGVNLQLSWIYLDDLIEALILAVERGKQLQPVGSQGIYFVGLPETSSLGDSIHLAARLQNRQHVRIIRAPRPLCLLCGGVIDLWNSITGGTRLLTLDKIRESLAGTWTCRVDRAREELGHTCKVNLADGFQRSLVWFKEHRWL